MILYVDITKLISTGQVAPGSNNYALKNRTPCLGRRARAGETYPRGAKQDIALVHAGHTVSDILRAGIAEELPRAVITACVTCGVLDKILHSYMPDTLSQVSFAREKRRNSPRRGQLRA